MAFKYAEIAFTDAVKAEQVRMGSREGYRHRQKAKDERGTVIGPDEQAFIEAADSFYMASVGETGWPYIQHRGGPPGFVRLVGPNRFGFADFRGNKQYISLGNVTGDNRVSLFFMDYPRRARLKIYATVEIVGLDAWSLSEQLVVSDYRAKVERFVLFDVQAFDWNCPQHITPRFTMAQIEALAQREPGN